MIRFYFVGWCTIVISCLPHIDAAIYNVGLWGDVPYVGNSSNVFNDTATINGQNVGSLYTKLVNSMNSYRPEFSIHMGDIKNGESLCGEPYYTRFDELAGALKLPVVYTPGDNEWTDCWQAADGSFDPLERLTYLRGRYFPANGAILVGTDTGILNGKIIIPNSAYPENRYFLYSSVVYIIAHVVGSNNAKYTTAQHPSDFACPSGLNAIDPGCQRAYSAFVARNTATLNLIGTGFQVAASQHAVGVVVAMQANMFDGPCNGSGTVCNPSQPIYVQDGFTDTWNRLKQEATSFRKPVLLAHGDFHYFQDFIPDPTVPNLRAVQVQGNKDIGWVNLIVSPQGRTLFRVSAKQITSG